MKEQLQQLRKSKNLTQEEISDIIGVKLSTYQKYERDAISPPYDTLIKIADFYGVSTDYLLGRGTGEQSALDELAGQFNMSLLEKKIVENYFKLPENMRGDLMEFLSRSVEEVMEESKAEAASADEPLKPNEPPKGKKVLKIASSSDHHPAEVKTLTPEEEERLRNAPAVTSEDSDL